MKWYKGKTFAQVDMIVRNIRADFIRKVYTLLICQYLIFIILIMIQNVFFKAWVVWVAGPGGPARPIRLHDSWGG